MSDFVQSTDSSSSSDEESSIEEVQIFYKFGDQSYSQLKSECLKKQILFEDEKFPVGKHLLVNEESGETISSFWANKAKLDQVQWLRPHEICREKCPDRPPSMFVGNFDRFDVNQGGIRNAWFLAALSMLAEKDTLFHNVVPLGQEFTDDDYAGIFKFRFWRFGQWVEVIIDDRLPVTKDSDLLFLYSNDPNEFWGPLLEKAYAKLNGSYFALENGHMLEAAVELTGGIPERIDLVKTKLTSEQIFATMIKAQDAGAIIGASLNHLKAREAQEKGLSQNAYTITKVVALGIAKTIPLIRLRNPRGHSSEWTGAWSDGDDIWSRRPELKSQLGVTVRYDGEFYMSLMDFLHYYGDLEICHISPDSAGSKHHEDKPGVEKKYEEVLNYGKWIKGKSAGGCGKDGFAKFAKNPQYFFTLNDPDPFDDEDNCFVIISLAQKKNHRKLPIGFKIYKCAKDTSEVNETYMKRNNTVARTDAFVDLIEVSKRFHLPQGRYCVIPSTYDSDQEGEFLLRIFIETGWSRKQRKDTSIKLDRTTSQENAKPVNLNFNKPESARPEKFHFSTSLKEQEDILSQLINSMSMPSLGEEGNFSTTFHSMDSSMQVSTSGDGNTQSRVVKQQRIQTRTITITRSQSGTEEKKKLK